MIMNKLEVKVKKDVDGRSLQCGGGGGRRRRMRAPCYRHAAVTSLATECQPVSDERVNGGGEVVGVVAVLAEQTGCSLVTLPERRPATSIHTNLNKG